MPSWLIPALKAVLPHVGDIIGAAKPVFTRRKPESGGDVQQQITELQAAASQNSEHVKELAEQLQSTLTALEKTAELADMRLKRATVFSAVAVSISIAALLVAAFTLLRL
jgi:hypothetical protein